MSVDAGYAAYLTSPARTVGATITGALAAWGTKAISSAIQSPLALKEDAQTEAIRQAEFLAGPIARDKHIVRGAQADLIGKLIVIVGDRLGYENGALAFVIGAAEAEGGGSTALTVLKRL